MDKVSSSYKNIYTETKVLTNRRLLDNRSELYESIKHSISKLEIKEYLESLLKLEISIFDNELINKRLLNNSLFYKVAKYNLCERLYKLFKENKDIDLKKLEFKLIGKYKDYIKLIYKIDNNFIELLDLQFNTFNKSKMNFITDNKDNIILSSSNIILNEVKEDGFIYLNSDKTKVKKLSWIDISNKIVKND